MNDEGLIPAIIGVGIVSVLAIIGLTSGEDITESITDGLVTLTIVSILLIVGLLALMGKFSLIGPVFSFLLAVGCGVGIFVVLRNAGWV